MANLNLNPTVDLSNLKRERFFTIRSKALLRSDPKISRRPDRLHELSIFTVLRQSSDKKNCLKTVRRGQERMTVRNVEGSKILKYFQLETKVMVIGDFVF